MPSGRFWLCLALANEDEAVQEARAAFDAGHYHDLKKALDASTAHLAGAVRELDAAAGTAPRRRR